MKPDADTATPRDWIGDFVEEQDVTWNVCGECLRLFLGVPTRIQCRLCAERRTV